MNLAEKSDDENPVVPEDGACDEVWEVAWVLRRFGNGER